MLFRSKLIPQSTDQNPIVGPFRLTTVVIMSLSPPRVPDDGTQRTYQLYWCYQCHRGVRVDSTNASEIACPRCFGHFLCEIDVARPRLVVDFTNFDPSPEARLLEALALMLDPPIRRFDPGLYVDPETENRGRTRFRPRNRGSEVGRHRDPEVETRASWPRSRRRRHSFDGIDNPELDTGIRGRPRTWIVLRPFDPSDQFEIPTPTGVDPRNYFLGTGMNELIEQLTQNDRQGPPPAPDSAINRLPTVKIMPEHLTHDSHCPVCKEEFNVDGEARELPCKHIYHSQCIVPWLQLHNSCPVCRLEIPAPSADNARDNESDDSNGGEGRRCPHLRWSQLTSLWPFRARYRSQITPHVDDNVGTPRRSGM